MVREIDLITIDETTVDSIGQVIPTEKINSVFADIASVTQSEFMAAGNIGLKPSLRFDVWSHEYNREEMVGYHGKRYTIYRTYMRPDGRTELYTEERVGDEPASNS